MIPPVQESGCGPRSSVYDVASFNGCSMRSIAALIAWLLWVSLALLPPARDARAAELKTSKERLSNKAADEQRVDNCGVPLDQRGITPRPDCDEAAPSRATSPGGVRENGAERRRP
jgi:hypothetical protein